MSQLEVAPTRFDVCGPLPAPGVTVLEASAGTGKTFTLTALVTRFVADGVSLSDILAVTFTRMATGELRERIRHRLTTAERCLARYLQTELPVGDDDEVVAYLASGPRSVVETRHGHLADAVAAFDAATIATTHGFCQLVLDGLGSAGDVAAGATLLEDPSDLVGEVVDDLYLRRALRHGPPPFSRAAARAAAGRAVANPDIVLSPPGGEDGPGLLSRLASKARSEVARRLQEGNLVTYDELLSRLADTLEDGARGPLACGRLRARYRVVLVDEFQDTDPIQWRIMRTAFGDGATRLVLVGDPKQAIYSFRGADVHAYLDAAATAHTFTLAQNWRADQPLLDATDAVLAPLHFGDEAILFRSVKAPADRQRAGTRGFPCAAPIRFRLVTSTQTGIQKTNKKQLLQKTALADWIAEDVAADIAVLLASRALVRRPGSPDGDDPRDWPEVAPADIAVLTKTNRQSIAVRDALRAAGVPSVVAGLDSVLSSPAATDWLRLLEALQEPASRSRAVAVALTPFVGMTPTEAATADERRWETVHSRVHRWSALLAERGVAALYRSITSSEHLPARVLAILGGERQLTDLGHVAQLLHAEATVGQAGAPSLRAWLAHRVAEAGTEQADAEARSRRLDSDAEAVQVLTVHRAKGLEFGVVYCPYLWDSSPAGRAPDPVVFHDAERHGVRSLDVGCSDQAGPARRRYDGHIRAAVVEQRGEDLRLMYVALTRARHQVVVWWGQADQSRHSPLGRLLMCRDLSTGALREPHSGEPKDANIRTALETLAARADPGLIAVETAGARSALLPRAAPEAGGLASDGMDAARFERSLDLRWRRASYTSITAAAHAEHFEGVGSEAIGSEPEDPGIADETVGTVGSDRFGGFDRTPEETPTDDTTATCPLSEMPGGPEVGTFVHRLLEQIDFAAPDIATEVQAVTARQPLWASAIAGDLGVLNSGLAAALTTSLGPMLGGASLADLRRADRLDELNFELPLAGGDDPSGEVTTADLAALVGRYLTPGGALGGYAERLADPLLSASLRGYLTGSLDLVFRHGGGEGTPRWYVADYKTNWLGEEGRSLTAWQYRPEALDAEMQRRHYPLQALLYMVALHRYLRWRQPDYDPEVHLGGALYLFLRGMIGPRTPVVDGQPCGVFTWTPPASLIVSCSDLLDEGVATA